jgi:hypothetical protein
MALRYCLSNWQAKDEAIFKQLLKTVHPGILKTTRKASSSGSNTTRLLIKVSMLLRPIPESKPTKDGMEGYSKFVNLMVNYYKEKKF